MCPESSVMVRSQNLVSLGRIEKSHKGAVVMPEVNIKRGPRETEASA
jgi:hypothetical protein